MSEINQDEIQSDNRKERFLDLVYPIEDQSRVAAALEVFWKTFADVTPEQMPDLIVIPEISGRMAFAASEPLINELYRVKNFPRPPILFMVATSVESRAAEHLRLAEEKNKEGCISSYELNRINQQENENKTRARSVMRTGATKIVNRLKFPKDIRVLLLDDYVSTGGSFQEIARAFHENPNSDEWKFSGFALMGGYGDPNSPYLKNPIDTVPYTMGIRDPHANPARMQYASYGWEYRNLRRMWEAAETNRMVHPRNRTVIMRPDFIGVNTDSLTDSITRRDEEAPILWKRWIRGALRKTGDLVLQKVKHHNPDVK